MIIHSLRLAIFGSRFHPVRCRCYHPSWLDRSQRIPLWGLPDLSPKDARTWWLSGEQVFPAQPPSFGKGEGHFIALLLYSDDAKPAGWFCQEEANKEFALENGLPAFSIQVLMPRCVLWDWHPTRALPVTWRILLWNTSFQRTLSKTHVISNRCLISNHAAKVEWKCAVYLRSQKKFWKKWWVHFKKLDGSFLLGGLLFRIHTWIQNASLERHRPNTTKYMPKPMS